MFDASDARLCAGSKFETNNGNPIVAQLGCVPLGKLKNVYYTKNERHHVPTWFLFLVLAWPKYVCSIVLAYVCAPTSSGAIKLGSPNFSFIMCFGNTIMLSSNYTTRRLSLLPWIQAIPVKC